MEKNWSFTIGHTSSCRQSGRFCSKKEEQHVWRAQRLHGRRHSSWQSIQGICARWSFCGLPRPSTNHVSAGSSQESRGVSSYLLWSNRFLRSLVKFFKGLLVVTKILLASNEDDGQARAEVEYFGVPLGNVSGICQRIGLDHCIPSLARCPANPENQPQSRWEWHESQDKTADEDDHNPPGQQYPIGLTRHAFHQPQHRQRSSRRQ